MANHCERLDEIGFNVKSLCQIHRITGKTLMELRTLKSPLQRRRYLLAGSLVEPTCVAYNAVIERGGGIRPGDNVVICGGGPIGLAACAILKDRELLK